MPGIQSPATAATALSTEMNEGRGQQRTPPAAALWTVGMRLADKVTTDGVDVVRFRHDRKSR